jgi:hypothetical protein
MSAVNKHAKLRESVAAFAYMHDELGIEPDTRSYAQLLTTGGDAIRADPQNDEVREIALEAARRLFPEWRARYPDPVRNVARFIASRKAEANPFGFDDPLDAPSDISGQQFASSAYVIKDTNEMWRGMIHILAL